MKIKGFVNFIRQQGVVGLAIGFILGGVVKEVISSFVEDIINPIIGALLGATGRLENAVLMIGSMKIRWGNFVAVLIDFIIISFVVYYGVKGLGLDKLDKEK